MLAPSASGFKAWLKVVIVHSFWGFLSVAAALTD
jgi:hypothetical protein